MFYGTYDCKIDSKNRVYLPISIRKEIKEELFITVLDGDTIIIREKSNEILNKIIDGIDKDTKEYIWANTYSLYLDKTGRILLPISTKAIFDERKVYILGKGEYIEVMSPKKYEEYISREKERVSKKLILN